ncbi:MAG: RdgB/HAM1 family non-canonical purine NTP pyrophosphatase [Bacteroidales bacterium]|nr:RdgB/HAM1 family non-canonical purine NTP pyrophosphatase [Bacteroidales bacterium]MDD6773448.1 RdgB/HAM1 family non-canonical purine NTP pyrophosphatase [Bacteroidales bacterium]
MKMVFATGNAHKLHEAGEILSDLCELVMPSSLGLTEDIPETGETLEENSLQKARYLYDKLKTDCFADDTGLEVEALGGAPGVYSARYAGEAKDSGANMDKLLRELQALGPGASRRARFRTVITLVKDGCLYQFEGEMKGSIANSRSGSEGFGYDPIFIADEYPDRTVAQLDEHTKNSISHRGRALRRMAAWLKTQNG